MKQFNGFEAKKSAGAREVLPAGGYVAKILNAEEVNYDWGAVLLISFDILEGDHRDFFANDYKSQDREDKKWRDVYKRQVYPIQPSDAPIRSNKGLSSNEKSAS